MLEALFDYLLLSHRLILIRPVSGVINRYIYLLYYWNHRPLIPLVLLSDFTYRNVHFESFFVNILSTFFIQLPFLACCWTDAEKKWNKYILNGRVFLKTSKYSIINLLPKRNDFQTNIHVIVIVYISLLKFLWLSDDFLRYDNQQIYQLIKHAIKLSRLLVYSIPVVNLTGDRVCLN